MRLGERLSALSVPSVLAFAPSCWLINGWPSVQVEEPLSWLDDLSVASSDSGWCCCLLS